MFLDSLDIANRALQHCGQPQILSVTEDTKANVETTFAYDKLRRVELQRNFWRFATKLVVLRAFDTSTMVLEPTLYSSTTQYSPGAIVSDANNYLWFSTAENNTGNTPGGNNEFWQPYFGPLTIEPWDTTGATAYWAGELVYVQIPNGAGTAPLYQIYMSLVNANSDTPNTATAWSATVTYNGDQAVTYSGTQWYSLIELNLNNIPTQAPAAWVSTTAYISPNEVAASDGFVYQASQSSQGLNPAYGANPTYWTNTDILAAWSATPTQTVSDIAWAPVTATMKRLQLLYPVGTGPSSESETRNVFRLPSNYLKAAPQDPKAGSTNYLGAPSGIQYEDWNFQDKYLVSGDSGPIIFRFIADVIKVRDMNDMFCEGLALKIATGVAKSLTQSHEKLVDLASEYKMVMGDARTANLIEIGPIEPPEDDFIVCRM